MLTAIRNICSTIFHYDEHRLGCEESMAENSSFKSEMVDGVIHHTITFFPEKKEARRLRLSDQFCRGCHQPHSLDENMRCEFCRRKPAEPRRSILGRIWHVLTTPRREKISIFNEPAWGIGHGEKTSISKSR